MKVICLDGSPCESFDTNRITLGPAQRVDVLIEDASELVELFEVSSSKALNAAIFEPISSKLTSVKNSLSTEPYYSWPDTNNAKKIDIRMQGGAMGKLSKATFEGEERGLRDLALKEAKLWAFNGNIGGYGFSFSVFASVEVVVI